MALGNFLSTAGLVGKGMGDAAYERDVRGADIEARRQQAEQRGQAIQLGKMGLEDVSRKRATEESIRSAATGTGPEAGYAPTFDAMIAAAKAAGDMGRATELETAKNAIVKDGQPRIIHQAMTNPAVGPRPDLVKMNNAVGQSKWASAELDDQGNLKFVDAQTGQTGTYNVGKLAVALGIIKPQIIQTPAGGKSTVLVGGQPTATITSPQREHQLSSNFMKLDVFQDGEKVGERMVDLRTGQPAAGEAATAGAGEGGAPSIRRNLPVLKEIDSILLQTPGMATKFDPANPLDNRVAYTQQGQRVAMDANRIALANKGIDAQTAIAVATRGQPGRNAKGEVVVQFEGREFKYYVPGQPAASAPPSGGAPRAPAQPPAAPSPGIAPQPAPQGGMEKVAAQDELPEVVQTPQTQTPKERHQSRVAAIRAEQARKKAEKPAEAFREIVKSGFMRPDDATLIEEAIKSGRLTVSEEAKAKRMLAKLRSQVATQ